MYRNVHVPLRRPAVSYFSWCTACRSTAFNHSALNSAKIVSGTFGIGRCSSWGSSLVSGFPHGCSECVRLSSLPLFPPSSCILALQTPPQGRAAKDPRLVLPLHTAALVERGRQVEVAKAAGVHANPRGQAVPALHRSADDASSCGRIAARVQGKLSATTHTQRVIGNARRICLRLMLAQHARGLPRALTAATPLHETTVPISASCPCIARLGHAPSSSLVLQGF
jgi:hypothetical protein